ncbi:hypothetical protein HPB48_015599 [Haemaphysalis longicornis]|uniref:CUB domain-containing protein n=1 Tax=Haemaphysalis longicornis TaxID=44386 RepID=A0A9J6FI45_HAELO|nr:hypothetical protein HPB48_015599 [Haemaphysalis longicornis]
MAAPARADLRGKTAAMSCSSFGPLFALHPPCQTGRKVECNRTLVLSPEHSRGALSSPNFPGTYPSSQRCFIDIQAPAGFRVELRFSEFLLEDHPG